MSKTASISKTVRRLAGFLTLAAALTGAPRASAAAQPCADMLEVPFAGGLAGQTPWTLLRGESGFCLVAGQRTIELNDLIPLSAERIDGAFLIFGRSRISNYLAVMSVPDSGSPAPVEMSFDQTSKLHLEGTFVLGGSAYLLAYDVAYSLPSGRRRVVPKEVHALYRIEQNEQGSRLALVNEEFLKSGIEAGLQIAVSGNHAWLCSGADCQKLTAGAGNAVTPGPGMQLLAGDKPLDVIEVVSDVSGQAYSLAALTFDDRTADMPPADAPVYFLCHMAAAASCQGLATDEIPYRLRIENGKPKWDAARDAGDASGLLSFDLPRAGLNGVANFGENNLEGRLAWSQAYYLNGLLSMIEQAGDLGLSEEFLEKLSQRFILECEELSLLTEHPYPGFMVKRYSLDREPLTSLLHIGRIMKPVWRGAALLPRGTVEKFSAIGRQFARADAAIEQYGLAEGRDPPAAHLRKFIPYWADGADLPWNYHSAWIEGLAWAPEKPDKMSALAKDLSEQFITKALCGLPEKWPYAAGNTLTGWSAADNVSSNTPVYGGDTSNPNGAHISYRSMDAMAVLAAGRTGITAEDAAVTRHLGALVPRGLLYPFVNEEFAARGKRMDLPVQAGRHYARIKLPWQVQNQPWALLSLPQR